MTTTLRHSRVAWAGIVAVAGLLGACGGTEAADTPATTEATKTVSDTSETTTSTAPAESVMEKWAAAFRVGDRAALDYTVPGSAAYLYTEGVVLLTESGTGGEATPTQDVDTTQGTVTFDGTALADFVLDGDRIADVSRNGVPLSSVISPGDGTLYETDGVSGHVHSIRYFDGNTQFLMTTSVSGTKPGSVSVREYSADGKQYSNIYAKEVLPGITVSYLDVFEGAPPGGTGYGYVWVGGGGDKDFTLQAPLLG